MSTDSDSDSNSNGWSRARGVVLKTLLLIGGAVLLKRLTKSATRWDHSRIVAHSLTGQKYSKEQAYRDPANYFNIRWLSCPAAEMVMVERFYILNKLFGGLLSSLFISDYCSFNHDSMKPYKSLLGFRARFFMVKPCPKEMKCDVELSTYAVRDAEGCKNFCDRSKDQRPQPEEVIGDIAEHLTTIHLKHSERGNPAYMKVQLHEMDFQILGFGESKEVLMNSSPQLLQVS